MPFTLSQGTAEAASDEGGGGGFILKRVLVTPDGVELELTGDEPPLAKGCESAA